MYTKGSLVICADTSLYKKDKAKIIERHYWDVIGQHINTIFGIAMVWALYWAYYFSRIFLLVKTFAHDFEHLQYKQSSRNKTQQHEACDVDISSQWNISCACNDLLFTTVLPCVIPVPTQLGWLVRKDHPFKVNHERNWSSYIFIPLWYVTFLCWIIYNWFLFYSLLAEVSHDRESILLR